MRSNAYYTPENKTVGCIKNELLFLTRFLEVERENVRFGGRVASERKGHGKKLGVLHQPQLYVTGIKPDPTQRADTSLYRPPVG